MPAMRSARTVRSLTLLNTALLLSAFTVPAFADIETVIVTAEKRVQNLQTVPVAVTAFTAETRDKIGIQTIQDMANFTPGMTYSTSTDRVTIRGISRQTNVLSADSGVANYTDGIYQSFAVEAGRSSLDLDRVEVLRGPQGTLYGRNSIGGAINQITPRPSDQFKAEFRADYGAYDHSFIEGVATGPINDDWQWRVYADWEHQGIGYTKNVIGPDEGQVINKWYVEGQLQGKISNVDIWDRAYWTVWNNAAGDAGSQAGGWTPADFPTYEIGQGAVVLNADYGCTQLPVQPLGGSAFYPNVPAAGGATTVVAGSVVSPVANPCQNPAVKNPWHIARIVPYQTTVPGAYFNTLQVTFHEDGYDIKFINGAEWYRYDLKGPTESGNVGTYSAPIAQYRLCSSVFCSNTTTGPLIDPQSSFDYQQQEFFVHNELNFISTGNGPLQWQAGLYWFQQHESQPVSAGETIGPLGGQAQLSAPTNAVAEGPFTLPHSPLGNRWFDDRIAFNDTSLAVFGQFDYKITDEITFTGGLRFSYDKKYGLERNRLVSLGIIGPGTAPGSTSILNPEAFGFFGFDLTPLGFPCPAFPPANPASCTTVVDYATAPDRGVDSPATYDVASGFASRRYNHSSNALTGTAKITWQPDDTTTAYASFTRGYKGGGFNTGIFSFINPKPWVNPEHVNSYEIGLKKGFGEFLLLDMAAYYYDLTQVQVPVAIAATPGGVNSPEFINIPHSTSAGFEAEAFITPIEHLTAIVSYSFDDAHITSSRVATFNPLTGVSSLAGVSDPADPNALAPGAKPLFSTLTCANTLGTAAATCGVDVFTLNGTVATAGPDIGLAGACTTVSVAFPSTTTKGCGFGWVIPQSLKGQRLPNVPKNKVAIALTYDWNIPEFGTITPTVTWRWLDKQYGTIFTRFYNLAPSWDQWDARIDFASPDSHWNVIVYGRNLANKIGYAQGALGGRLSGSSDIGLSNAPSIAGYCAPTTFGGTGGFGGLFNSARCNFVQGYTAIGGVTPAPAGYGHVRGESAFGTVSNFNVNPPTTYGIQLQFRF